MTATRREALATFAAIATVPAIAVAEPTAPVSSDRAQWDSLLALREQLQRAVQEQDHRCGLAESKSDHWRLLNEQLDALCSRASKVDDKIMDTPAPDREALLWKIENFFGPADTLWAEDYADQFYADARRLLAGRA